MLKNDVFLDSVLASILVGYWRGFWEGLGGFRALKIDPKRGRKEHSIKIRIFNGFGSVLGGFGEGLGRVLGGFWEGLGRVWRGFGEDFRRILWVLTRDLRTIMVTNTFSPALSNFEEFG